MSTALDPRSIEIEIARIRERESNPYLAGIKTNLFNLVIFRARADGPDPTAPALQFLLGKRPARIITLDAGRGADTTVSVSGRCYPDKRNRGVCFEEISIASGNSTEVELGTWSPLLIRDLPVYIWWLPGLSPLPPLLLDAAELCDKVMVDTDSAPDPLRALGQLAVLRERTRGVMGVSDLAWRRSFPLRVQAARAFNPPDARGRLSGLREVHMEGGSRAEALQLALWLSARLGWSARAGEGPLPVFTTASGMPVGVSHSAAAPLSKGFTLRFSFADGGGAITASCGPDGCGSDGPGRSAYRPVDEGEALLEEVDSLKQDPLFLEVISAAAGAMG